jgi:teichuronic acid biosynthesis glycosyltransferase TuaH
VTDVVLSLLSSWNSSAERNMVFSEDRLALELLSHPDVERLLVCDSYRSVLGKAAVRLRRRPEAVFPSTATRSHFAPLRLRRRDPADPRRAVRSYESRLRASAAARGLRRPAIITSNPLLAGFGGFDWAGPVTYYAWDDWLASEPHRRWWPAYHQAFSRLRETQRRVCAVSEAIMSRLRPTGPSAVIPNGIDEGEWLEPVDTPAWFISRPRPRLLYVGTLDRRIDVHAMERVARAFPGGSLTLIGPDLAPAHFSRLAQLENVGVRPWTPRREIVGVIRAADACLIPHVRNALTEAMSPLKLFEYLAGGRPVAAVDLPPIAGVRAPGLVLVGEADDFVTGVRRALALGPAGEGERRTFLARNSWKRRFDELLGVALGA